MTDKSLTRADLSPDQADVYEAIRDWTMGRGHAHKKSKRPSKQLEFDFKEIANILTVGGFAGTGKTSLLGVFAAETKALVAYVTYTGRASSVLHRKLKASGAKTTTLQRPSENAGFNEKYHDSTLPYRGGPSFVGTIHRLLYAPIINKHEELVGWRRRASLDRAYDLIVVDEASMVGDQLLEDLALHDVPILAVGDHGQLPPVMASGELMKRPELRLEKIHRQAEKNPIIALSKVIREDGFLDEDLADGKHIRFRPKEKVKAVLRKAYTRYSPLEVGLICHTNRKRIQLNMAARAALRHKGSPEKDEIVICLKNDPPVFNGMRGILAKDGIVGEECPWLLTCAVQFPDEKVETGDIEMCSATFNRERMFESIEEIQALGIPIHKFGEAGFPYDFGYAMTCHKAQGSQFKHAILYLDRRPDPNSEDWRRYAYTAVTRASERLTVLR
jgi:exodeoxyribonuclease-5